MLEAEAEADFIVVEVVLRDFVEELAIREREGMRAVQVAEVNRRGGIGQEGVYLLADFLTVLSR